MLVGTIGIDRLRADLVGTLEGRHGQGVPSGTWIFGATAARRAPREPLGVAMLARLTPKDHGVPVKAWYELVVLAEDWAQAIAASAGPERAGLLQVTEDIAGVDDRINLELRRLAARMTLPGFRTGRVPASMIAERFGPRVYAEVAYEIILTRCAEAKLDGQDAYVIGGGICAPGRPFSCLVVAPPAPGATADPGPDPAL